MQAELRGIEVVVTEVARLTQLALEVVRPAVVPAHEARTGAAATPEERPRAVSTAFGEPGEHPVFTDDHEPPPAGELVGLVVAGLLEMRAEAGRLPLAGEDRVSLALEEH